MTVDGKMNSLDDGELQLWTIKWDEPIVYVMRITANISGLPGPCHRK